MLKNVFGLVYGILLSYLIWIVFHFLTPIIMSFGWLGFVGILVVGSIAEIFLYNILTYSMIPLVMWCKWGIFKLIVCVSMIAFGIACIADIFSLNMEYTIVKWFLAIPYVVFIGQIICTNCYFILNAPKMDEL